MMGWEGSMIRQAWWRWCIWVVTQSWGSWAGGGVGRGGKLEFIVRGVSGGGVTQGGGGYGGGGGGFCISVLC